MDEINATDDQERIQEQVQAAVTAYPAMPDAFVHHPERRIAPEAGRARPGQSPGA
jgi:hypothetical protein